MARHSAFDSTQILQAAANLVHTQGLPSATISAISEAVNAPVGSIYHRFASRDEILVAAWLKADSAFQTEFLELLRGEDASNAGLQAALLAPRWVRQHPAYSSLLIKYRKGDLIGGNWPEHLAEQAVALSDGLSKGLREYSRKRLGNASKDNLARCRFALIDMPYGAVRPYVGAGLTPPTIVDELIEASYRAIFHAT